VTDSLPQGHPDLIATGTASRLLASRELARPAYAAHDGTPRVFPGGVTAEQFARLGRT
jgi:hypothetical protein